jgi:Prealbumin-like fold domain
MNKLCSLGAGVLVTLFCYSAMAADTDTGVEGIISISPIRGGPTRIGVPNSRPFSNVEFLVKKQEETVASFKTDAEGHFRVQLPPGHYTIVMKEGKGAIGRHGPFEVDIGAGQMKQVEWTCDSGMR